MRGLKHLIHRKRSPFSFSGDANPFVLADISPNRGIAQRGRQGGGQAVPLSFSGDANPFVLADISPSRGIAQRGRQEVGKRCSFRKGEGKGWGVYNNCCVRTGSSPLRCDGAICP